MPFFLRYLFVPTSSPHNRKKTSIVFNHPYLPRSCVDPKVSCVWNEKPVPRTRGVMKYDKLVELLFLKNLHRRRSRPAARVFVTRAAPLAAVTGTRLRIHAPKSIYRPGQEPCRVNAFSLPGCVHTPCGQAPGKTTRGTDWSPRAGFVPCGNLIGFFSRTVESHMSGPAS